MLLFVSGRVVRNASLLGISSNAGVTWHRLQYRSRSALLWFGLNDQRRTGNSGKLAPPAELNHPCAVTRVLHRADGGRTVGRGAVCCLEEQQKLCARFPPPLEAAHAARP